MESTRVLMRSGYKAAGRLPHLHKHSPSIHTRILSRSLLTMLAMVILMTWI